MATIGERIKNRRVELGMSQEELAKLLGYKSRSSINKIELNGQNLVQSKIKAIADALNTTPGYIMGWEDEPESAAPEPLTPAEHELIRLYRKLDENDRRETRRYISDFLLAKPKYLYEEKRGYA